MTITLALVLASMGRAKDHATAEAILRINLERFPKDVEELRGAFLRRVADLRKDSSSLEEDVWASMALAAAVMGRPHNPNNRNPQMMPELVRRHGPAEAVRRTIVNNPDGTTFFAKCVAARDLRFTSEAICLRHREQFDEKTVAAAAKRLARYPKLPK